MSSNPIERLEPADNPLLTLIFDRVDDSMLLEIAKADYGDDVDIHLAALHQIRANNIPIPMQWHPGEVLLALYQGALHQLTLSPQQQI
jgi:hypothetical protein